MVSNEVLTSMLSSVPGSVNRELLESSLLTTWPFCASRPVGGIYNRDCCVFKAEIHNTASHLHL